MIAKLVTNRRLWPETLPTKMIFRPISEVKVHVYGQISGQKYEFPAFTGKITHAHTVCSVSGPFSSSKGLGTRLSSSVIGTPKLVTIEVESRS